MESYEVQLKDFKKAEQELTGKERVFISQDNNTRSTTIDEIRKPLAEQLNDMALNLTSYKLSTEADYSNALNNAIAALPEEGGAILIPPGKYEINNNIEINKTVKIYGCGYSSILKFNNASIISSNDSKDKLIIEDCKIEYTGDTELLYIRKTLNAGESNFEINNVWFHANDSGALIKLYGVTNSGISHCWFTQNTIQGTSTGIMCFGDDSNGAMNLDISYCKFRLLSVGIDLEGSSEGTNYVFTCGYRMNSNMMISCSTGLRARNCDYVIFDNGMIDYSITPIVIEDVNNIKLRNNYVFTTHSNGTKLINIKKSKNHSTLYGEISGNFILNGTYTASDSMIESYGIYVEADGQTLDQLSIYNNGLTRLTNAIYLCTTNSGTISKADLKNNKCSNTVAYITLADSGVKYTNLDNNSYDKNTVSYNVIDNGVGTNQNIIFTKDINVTINSGETTKLVSTETGDLNKIVNAFFIYNDAVYYLNPLINFDDKGNIYLRIINKSDTVQTLKIRLILKK